MENMLDLDFTQIYIQGVMQWIEEVVLKDFCDCLFFKL